VRPVCKGLLPPGTAPSHRVGSSNLRTSHALGLTTYRIPPFDFGRLFCLDFEENVIHTYIQTDKEWANSAARQPLRQWNTIKFGALFVRTSKGAI
jgi:hypothetical protein